MSNKKGEIATILTLSSLIFLGVVSLTSLVFLKKTIKTQPRASSCSQVDSVSFIPSSINAGQTFTCNLSGQIIDSHTMVCGWSKNGGWPQGQISGRCPGNNCTFQVKMEDQVDPNASYELVGFDFRQECGPNTGKRIPLTITGVNPQPNQSFLGSGDGSGGSSGNGCFNINANFQVEPAEGNKKAFFSRVNFTSSKGGQIRLEYNGIPVAGPNDFSGGNFTYDPKWTQPYTHDFDAAVVILPYNEMQSIAFNYTGEHTGCTPQAMTISCTVGVSQEDGSAWVSGTNCNCRNCNNNQPASTSTSTQTPTRVLILTSTPTRSSTSTITQTPTLTSTPNQPPPPTPPTTLSTTSSTTPAALQITNAQVQTVAQDTTFQAGENGCLVENQNDIVACANVLYK